MPVGCHAPPPSAEIIRTPRGRTRLLSTVWRARCANLGHHPTWQRGDRDIALSGVPPGLATGQTLAGVASVVEVSDNARATCLLRPGRVVETHGRRRSNAGTSVATSPALAEPAPAWLTAPHLPSWRHHASQGGRAPLAHLSVCWRKQPSSESSRLSCGRSTRAPLPRRPRPAQRRRPSR